MFRIGMVMGVALWALPAFGQSTCFGDAGDCSSWGEVQSTYPLFNPLGSSGGNTYTSSPDDTFHGDHPPITDLPSCFQHCQTYSQRVFSACMALLDGDDGGYLSYQSACAAIAQDDFDYCIADCVVVGRDTAY